MKTLQQFITERATDIVYHITQLDKALSILQSDKFAATPAIALPDEMEFNKGRWYQFSTARTIDNNYFRSNVAPDLSCYFVLDGRKLNYNYSSVPVNYYSDTEKGKTISTPYHRESEDRILTHSPYIPSAKSYILALRIYMDPGIFWETSTSKHIDPGYRNDIKSMLRKVLILCKKANIKYYVFVDDKDFLNVQTKNAIDVTPEYLTPQGSNTKNTFDPLFKTNKQSKYNVWVELARQKHYLQLSSPSKEIVQRLLKTSDLSGVVTELSSEIRRKQFAITGGAENILRVMREFGAKDPKDYVQKIKEKWQKIV